jgi:long-chain fatty acid transport protein
MMSNKRKERGQICKVLRKLGEGLVLLMVLVWLFCLNSSALGAGFALMNQGTEAMAQGNAFVAEADNASAIFYNPAGLSQLKRPQFYQGSFLTYPDREFQGTGQFAETVHRAYPTITAYFAYPVNDRVALGLGFFSPFGLGSSWPAEWAGRYLITYSTLKTYNVNPVVSVKLLDNLSLAAGLDVMWSSVRMKKKFPMPFGLPDGESNLGGDGNGVGYNLGVLYEPLGGLKLGVAYRSEIFVKHKGELATSLPIGAFPNIGGSANITYPPTVTMGINYSRLKPFTFELDATWTGWSTYDELRVTLDKPIFVNGVLTNSLVTPKNWHDAWAFRFGANYEVKEGMKVRAGYIYDLTPVPSGSFDPQLPDANRHVFSVGGDLKIKRFTLGVAYNYILIEGRSKSNAIGTNGVPLPAAFQANGPYRSDVHILGLSWSFQF